MLLLPDLPYNASVHDYSSATPDNDNLQCNLYLDEGVMIRTIAEEVEGRGDSRFEPVFEQVLRRLAGVAVHLHKSHLPVVLRQTLQAP